MSNWDAVGLDLGCLALGTFGVGGELPDHCRLGNRSGPAGGSGFLVGLYVQESSGFGGFLGLGMVTWSGGVSSSSSSESSVVIVSTKRSSSANGSKVGRRDVSGSACVANFP